MLSPHHHHHPPSAFTTTTALPQFLGYHPSKPKPKRPYSMDKYARATQKFSRSSRRTKSYPSASASSVGGAGGVGGVGGGRHNGHGNSYMSTASTSTAASTTTSTTTTSSFRSFFLFPSSSFSFSPSASTTTATTTASASSTEAARRRRRGGRLLSKVARPFESTAKRFRIRGGEVMMLRHHKKPSTLDFRCIGEQMCDGLVRVSSLHLDNLLATGGGFGGAVLWDEAPKIPWKLPQIHNDWNNWFAHIG